MKKTKTNRRRTEIGRSKSSHFAWRTFNVCRGNLLQIISSVFQAKTMPPNTFLVQYFYEAEKGIDVKQNTKTKYLKKLLAETGLQYYALSLKTC